MRLGRIGFDHVAGYLANGMLSVQDTPALTATTERISAQLAAERIATSDAPLVVDVRTLAEHDAKAIAGSVCLPLNSLQNRTHELPRSRPLLVHCAGGYRSSAAASILQREGFENVSELAGGIAAWEAAGLPLLPQT